MRNIRRVVRKWNVLLRSKEFVILFILGLLLVVLAEYLLVIIATYKDGFSNFPSVGDLILDNIAVRDWTSLYLYGPFVALVITLFYLIFLRPDLFPFALFAFGAIDLLRAFSISLTNIAPPADIIYLQKPELIDASLKYLFMKSDLFFSGHVSHVLLPFFILKEYKIRWFMLFWSFVMGVTVLVMHVHYSIDVFAAFFITYGTYKVVLRIYRRVNKKFERLILLSGLLSPVILCPLKILARLHRLLKRV